MFVLYTESSLQLLCGICLRFALNPNLKTNCVSCSRVLAGRVLLVI